MIRTDEILKLMADARESIRVADRACAIICEAAEAARDRTRGLAELQLELGEEELRKIREAREGKA